VLTKQLTVIFRQVLQPQDETNDFKIQDLLLALRRSHFTLGVMALRTARLTRTISLVVLPFAAWVGR
jgi:hypothetical protein